MEECSIKYKILDAAMPYLAGKTVTDLVIGISLLAVQLSDGSCGVSYILRYGLPPGCGAFGYAKDVIGMDATEAARWSVEGSDNIMRSIGGAVLTAASRELDISDDTDKSCHYGMDINNEDVVGMIGLIGPVAKVLKSQVKKLYIFDEGVSLYEDNAELCPMDKQPDILPLCTKMIITGSSTINGSIDGLLKMCKNAKQIALVGSSTPMFPEAFKDTNVVSLGGAWWPREEKDDLFKAISQGAGIKQLKRFMKHKIAYV